ncbi:ribonucleotide reductase subunit 1 [Ateline alphaherpesvirus 1]|uniref:Ribonucleoside-diphosphate reductase large subunit n=1 Tax=Herpesvirus ateles type 1 (strain Lennette) TaxID=35243 RepID=A0A1S6JLL8_HSVA1|nr:ribonucleotide reductase subunit 1 [Ateline alphaherpesvirus 1]AQS79176.1 ribonucleotide reductase subunit 1 [Ateline alphaherpesvirus 1]
MSADRQYGLSARRSVLAAMEEARGSLASVRHLLSGAPSAAALVAADRDGGVPPSPSRSARPRGGRRRSGAGPESVADDDEAGGRSYVYHRVAPDTHLRCTNSYFIQCGSNSTMIATAGLLRGGPPPASDEDSSDEGSSGGGSPEDLSDAERDDASLAETAGSPGGSGESLGSESDDGSFGGGPDGNRSDVGSPLGSASTSESFTFLRGDEAEGEPQAGGLDDALLRLCLAAARRDAAAGRPRGAFDAPRPGVTLRMAATLREVILAVRNLGLEVPAPPPDAGDPRAFAEYATRVVNVLKPRVRRSHHLYMLLGRLVHLRVESRAGPFRRWMAAPELDLDPALVRDLRSNERGLSEVLDEFARGPEHNLKNRGLQSALKYEEFYLRPWGDGRLESVAQMYTRVAGALATGAAAGGEIHRAALGRPGSWIELFGYFFRALVSQSIVPSTPAMLYLGSRRRFTSSCYLVNPERADAAGMIDAITRNVGDILAEHGGVGLSVQSFNDAHPGGASVMPALKLLDSLVMAHNAHSHRPTGVCVYLEPWHTDVMAVLRMRGLLAGEEALRCDNIFSALWVPDLFFERLIRHLNGERGVTWTLFDGDTSRALARYHGAEFERMYESLEAAGGPGATRVPIQEIAFAVARGAASTGSPFVMFKDACNRHYIYDTQGAAIACSNLCTEIVHPADARSSGVCNLASVNLAECVEGGRFDFERLRRAVRACALMVNVMIDTTELPNQRCRRGHDRLRSMGIGMQGLHTACLRLGLDMASPEFRELNAHIAEVMLLAAMQASSDLCVLGLPPFADFGRSMYRTGRFHWEGFPGAAPRHREEWALLRRRVIRHGLRNSQFVALMPTVSSSQVSESSEGFAPLFTNMFSKVGRSGETLRPNVLLLEALHDAYGGDALERALDHLEAAQWSVARAFPCLGPDHPLRRFRTAFEYDQTLLIDLCADRAPYVDHSQSMTLYVTEAADGTLPASVLIRLLVHAYKRGLKTGMYYCKVRKATNSGVFGGSEDLVCTSCVL